MIIQMKKLGKFLHCRFIHLSFLIIKYFCYNSDNKELNDLFQSYSEINTIVHRNKKRQGVAKSKYYGSFLGKRVIINIFYNLKSVFDISS